RFATTNTQGQYQMSFVPAGTVSLKTTCQGYNDQYTEGVVLVAEENTVQNITLTPMTQISITGFVKNATTQAGIQAAEIRLIGYENYSAVTTNTGAFTFPAIYSGQTYQLKVLKPGYELYSMNLVVGTTNMTVPDILVNQSPSIVETLVGDPTSTTTAYQYPVNFFYKSSISQTIYMADELSSEYYLGAGTPITQISYDMNLGGNIPANKPLKVWMANTTESSFATTSTWIPQSEFTLVWDGTVDLSTSGPHELTFELDEPYPYEGNNLVIMIQRPLDDAYYSTTNTFKTTTTAQYPNRTIYRQSDTVDQNLSITTVGTLTNTVPNTSFTFVTTGFATLTGVTTSNGAPLAGVKVAIDGTNNFAMSDEQGNYTINYVIAGENSITASKFGYYNNTVQLNMPADEITTQNFNLTQLPNVTVTGVVHGSDTGAGLSNATVSLTGYEDYQVTTNANGEFTIPGVYAAQTYTIGIVRAGYQNYTGQAVVGDTNTNLGTLVMSEIAYPVTNVFAEISNNTIILSWNAPQVPNGVADDSRREGSLSATGLSKASSHKIVISKDAFTGNALTINKDNVTTTQMGVIGNNTNFKEKTNYTRALTGYTIWRTPLEGVDNQDFWTSIQNNYDGLSYADQSWGQCPSGEYKYVVSATYTGNVLAEPVFSNTVAKDMMASVTFNL
ncbi:MAG TPA: carboxypeptidase regulatory-like domain-containing protein, partial [Candidatus Cloacimonadota bacterium]|nr:carboxypeptidase regulatory-like domain-containing protein [Candidatus Cloacimonadota bacterium]